MMWRDVVVGGSADEIRTLCGQNLRQMYGKSTDKKRACVPVFSGSDGGDGGDSIVASVAKRKDYPKPRPFLLPKSLLPQLIYPQKLEITLT